MWRGGCHQWRRPVSPAISRLFRQRVFHLFIYSLTVFRVRIGRSWWGWTSTSKRRSRQTSSTSSSSTKDIPYHLNVHGLFFAGAQDSSKDTDSWVLGLRLGFCGGTFRLDSRHSGVGFWEPAFLLGGVSAPGPAILSLVLGCLRGLAGGLRVLLSSRSPPPPPPGPPPTLSMLPTEWQESERGAMALRQG